MSLSDLSNALAGLAYDPTFNLGTGLMAASGPSLTPHSFGQDLARGMQQSQAARMQAMQARMLGLQAQRYGLQNSAIEGVVGNGGMGSGQMGGGQIGQGGGDFATPDQARAAVANVGQPGMAPYAPMLSSANGTPGTSYAAPQQAPQAGGGQGGGLASAMLQDPMFKMGFAFDPSQASQSYLNRAYPQPTNVEKLMAARRQVQDGTPQAQALDLAIAKETGAMVNLRQGATFHNLLTGQTIANPKLADGQVLADPNNPAAGSYMVPGTLGAIQGVSGAQAAGKAAVTPYSYTGPDGRTVNTTQGNYVGAVNGQGQPGAQGSPDQVVGQLAAKATEMVKQGIPEDVAQAWLQRQAQAAGVGYQPVQGGAPAGAIAGPAPGFQAGQETVAKSNAQRYQDVINTGMQAASRMNVYDNLRGVLNEGTQTGYGTQWQNKALSTIMNTPVLSAMIPDSAKNKAINYQVAMKYIAQGTLQRFQGQKGTGTDAQLQAVAHGNTNPEQLAGAMQDVSRYLESQDLADLAKANAQQSWAAQNGYDYSKQDRFENDWRSHNNPLVFQYKTADAPARQKMLDGLSKEQRVKLANDMQWMSPYITTTPAGQ